VSDEAARRIYEAVDGIPNDVQRLAYEAYLLPDKQVDLATVDAALERVVQHSAIDYEESFARLSPAQQRILLALARAPREQVYGREFLTEIDVANANAVTKALDVLSDLELVARHGRLWTVSDAFFRAWLTAPPVA
jgi:hypothetical protein